MRTALAAIAVVALALVGACTANDDVPAPVLASVSPAQASVGATVVISGSYLCQQPDGSDLDPLACAHTGSVTFGVVPASVSEYMDSQVTAQVPDLMVGATTIAIATGGLTTNTIGFTVVAPTPD